MPRPQDPHRQPPQAPPQRPRTPTLQSIADRLGLSRSTVSLALRNSPLVNSRTHAEVWRVARELKYKPNPMVAALMASLRGSLPRDTQPIIAFLSAFPEREGWRYSSSFVQYYEGAQARCEECGFSLRHFWLNEPGMSGPRMGDILHARGIRGVLLAPLPQVDMKLDFPWEHFALASLGYSFRTLALHRAVNNQFLSTETALKRLHALGYRRIGLVLYRVEEDRGAHSYLAAYLTYQQGIPLRNRLRAFLPVRLDKEGFIQWCKREKPDAILSFESKIEQWVSEIGLRMPEDIVLAGLHTSDKSKAGIDQQPRVVGAAAVDLIISQINNNESGLPEHAKTVLIEGNWRDRPNIPPRTPKA